MHSVSLGGDRDGPNVIEVLDIACDECPVGGHVITRMCRGCIAHCCMDACPRGAIVADGHQRFRVVKGKCVECGRCLRARPYNVVHNIMRPCRIACKAGAIDMDAEQNAGIDNEKCIACGACAHQCSFGAIMDKSFIVRAVDMLSRRGQHAGKKLRAAVARPSRASLHTQSPGRSSPAYESLALTRWRRRRSARILPRGRTPESFWKRVF